jgi:hypothetical protein
MSRSISVALLLIAVCLPGVLRAEDDEVSLGDLARSVRSAKQGQEKPVIDNDNLPVMMQKAEAERLNGKPVFSIDPSGKAFRMTSPDGTCSLSFDAKATALISTPYVSSNLPNDELTKLEGQAAIRDGAIEVTLRNPTAWELKEIVVGITIVQSETMFKTADLVTISGVNLTQRPPDTTFLYHLKASALPNSTAVFQGGLGDDLNGVNNWHWALVGARGIPPAAPGTISPASATAAVQPLPAFAAPAGSVNSVAGATSTSEGSTQNPVVPASSSKQ